MKRFWERRTLTALAVATLLILLFSVITHAQPMAAEGISIEGSERKSTTSTGIGVPAQAGNVTQLAINASRVSTHWQGYYGNVSGDITLDDADSNTLYSWGLTSISGEIFAVNTSATVNWANITCVNMTNATSPDVKINQTTLDTQYGIDASEVDGFNDTFASTFSDTVLIGSITIAASSNCRQAYLFVNNQSQSTDYKEILLFDNKSALVYTSILEPKGTQGFDGSPWDFEMLVAQNNAATGTYYFYVELS